ncbi:hypothetical protein OPT61_g8345 [Boeremia exigua]|uniref:Uncharacterized protein n=1 Tax=Boeremia exigua TaxID=749465 RepID=A0ACC2HZG4_9PLEO|nr:hypothetical protein OPT61_g8345 [Boeremia exigua]
MDIGHNYSPLNIPYQPLRTKKSSGKASPESTATAKVETSVSSSNTGTAMVDNKGWRKKIGGRPKELPPIKTVFDDTAGLTPTEVTFEAADRRRHGWRKTIAASRPTTPMTPAPSTPTPEDVEDTKSERSEASTPRQESKPKLTRYTSLFATHKQESPGPIFSEPWSVEAVPNYEDPWSYVDPIVIMESIHSHMCKNYMVPIPLQYTSGLFQIFDDYRKLRWNKEHLETREQEAIEQLHKVTGQWRHSEELYEAEIRRLELLIARGTTGMSGLMQARQGTLVGHGHQHRRALSTQGIDPRYRHMSPMEIDKEIKEKSQQVLLHRPTSPSMRMTALSRQFGDATNPDPVTGTPPNTEQESTLSRKVKSELNLVDSRYVDAVQPATEVTTFNRSRTTKSASHEVATGADQLTVDDVEFDALLALKELGALVARRKGMDGANFINTLMALLTSADTAAIIQPIASSTKKQNPLVEANEDISADDGMRRSPPRKPQPQTCHESDQERRRHFSFELGDDQMQEHLADLSSYQSSSPTDSSDSETKSLADLYMSAGKSRPDNGNTTPLHLSSDADCPKPTMIPSPVQTVGRVRRENSMSSLQSTFIKNSQDSRHNSRTSIQTVFGEASSANASIKSKSRSSSKQNLRVVESLSSSKERQDSLSNRHSTFALAAARAAESRSSNVSRGSTLFSTATSASQVRHSAGQQRAENNVPGTCKNAGDNTSYAIVAQPVQHPGDSMNALNRVQPLKTAPVRVRPAGVRVSCYGAANYAQAKDWPEEVPLQSDGQGVLGRASGARLAAGRHKPRTKAGVAVVVDSRNSALGPKILEPIRGRQCGMATGAATIAPLWASQHFWTLAGAVGQWLCKTATGRSVADGEPQPAGRWRGCAKLHAGAAREPSRPA